MKAVVVLLILGLGGWLAWSQGWVGSADDDDPAGASEDGAVAFGDLPGGVALGGDDDQAPGGSDPAAGGSDPAAGGTASAPVDEAALREARELFERAMERWRSVEAAGKDPATSDQAPALARDFSAVLRSTYNQPHLADLQRRLVDEILTPLADVMFFSRRRYLDDPTGVFGVHVVEPGDILDDIGRTYGLSYEFLNILRGRDTEDDSLKVGEQLKIVHAKETGYLLHVDKSDYFLDLYIAGLFARRYPVGIGAPETPTPTGTSFIDMREWQPDWTVPGTSRVLPWNHPENVLGPVWLRIADSELGQSGIGFHGYNGDGPAVGVQASNGCIRLRNPDATQLYHLMVRCQYDRQTGAFISRAPMRVEIVE